MDRTNAPAPVDLRADALAANRVFWIEIRRALLIALKAIETAHGLGNHRQV